MDEQVSAHEDTVELRGPCPRAVADVLDAISLARSLTRTQLVNEILGDWTRRVMHEHSVLARIARINPPDEEASGKVRKP